MRDRFVEIQHIPILFYLLMQGFLVPFQREQVIRPLLNNFIRYFILAACGLQSDASIVIMQPDIAICSSSIGIAVISLLFSSVCI